MTIIRQEKQHAKHKLANTENQTCCPALKTTQLMQALKHEMSVNELIDFYSWKISDEDAELLSTPCAQVPTPKLCAYPSDNKMCEAIQKRRYLVTDEATAWYKAQRCLTQEKPLSRQEALVERHFQKPIVKAENFQRISPQFLYLLQQHADKKFAEEQKSLNLATNLWNYIYYPIKRRCDANEENQCKLASLICGGNSKNCAAEGKPGFVTEAQLNQCCQALNSEQFVKRTCNQLKQANASSELQLCCESVLLELLSPSKKCDESEKATAQKVRLKQSKQFKSEDTNALKESKRRSCKRFFLQHFGFNRNKRHLSGGQELKAKPTNICIKKSLKPILKKTQQISKEPKNLTYSKSTQIGTGRQTRATAHNTCSKRSPTPHPASNARQNASRNSEDTLLREIWRKPEYRRDPSEERFSASRTQRKPENKDDTKRLFAGYDDKFDSLVSVVGCKPVLSLHELTKIKLMTETSKKLGVAGDSNQNMELKDIRTARSTSITPAKNNEPSTIKKQTIKINQKAICTHQRNSDLDVPLSLHSHEIYRRRTQQQRDLRGNTICQNDRFEASLSSSSGPVDTDPSILSDAYDRSKSYQFCKNANKFISDCYSTLNDFNNCCSSIRQNCCRERCPNKYTSVENKSKCVAPQSPRIAITSRHSKHKSEQNLKTFAARQPLKEDDVKRYYTTSDFYSSEDNLCFRQYTYCDKPKSKHYDRRESSNKHFIKKYYDPSRKRHQLHSKGDRYTSESSIISTDFDYKHSIEPTKIDSHVRCSKKQANMKRRYHKFGFQKNKSLERSETSSTQDSTVELKRAKHNRRPKILNITAKTAKNYSTDELKPTKKSKNSCRTQEKHIKNPRAPYYAKKPVEVESKLSKGKLLQKNAQVFKMPINARNPVKTSESFKRKISSVLERKLIMVVDAAASASSPKTLQKQVTLNRQSNNNVNKPVVSKEVANQINHITDSGKLNTWPKKFSKSECKRKQFQKKPSNKL